MRLSDPTQPGIIRILTWGCIVAASLTCLWQLTYIALRTIQPYQLDAFEEYEIMKASQAASIGDLYRNPELEVLPTAYPPLHYVLLRLISTLFGTSFIAGRLLSLSAFCLILAAGYYWLRDMPARLVATLTFATLLLSCHDLTRKWFELCKSDSVLIAFLVWSFVMIDRNRPVLSSLLFTFACLTKQNAILFCPFIIAGFLVLHGKRSALISALSIVWTGFSYGFVYLLSDGWFLYWVVQWTANHGVDWWSGARVTFLEITRQASWLWIVFLLSLIRRFRDPWTWLLSASVIFAWIGMSKRGGIENHLYPLAVVGSLVAARMVSTWWHENGSTFVRLPKRVAWMSGLLAGWTVFVYPQLPQFTDFEWLQKRRDELVAWQQSIKKLDGRPMVAHHFLLARSSGSDCHFSDIIMRFPNVEVAQTTRSLIQDQTYEWVVLTQEPIKVSSPQWSELVEEYYLPVGRLDFQNRSGLLPDLLFHRKSKDPSGNVTMPNTKHGAP